MSKRNTSSILVIPDLHSPYHHPDTLAFLKAVKKKYKPTMTVCLGDEVDNHAISFHDNDVDLSSAGDELKLAAKFLQDLQKIFPVMTILDSNHGSLAVRRFKHHGIPMKYLSSYEQIYGLKQGWEWKNDLKLKLPDGSTCYFCHGITKNGLKLVKERGLSCIQGHHHCEFKIEYASTPDKLLWSLQSGCLIDRKSMAFAYDKLNLSRPILGCSLIIDSQPVLVPMLMDDKGRWIGRL